MAVVHSQTSLGKESWSTVERVDGHRGAGGGDPAGSLRTDG
jgi:hypothetical protein